ncbi:MAG: type II toxin-antitoxin system prevent-host-death family antitoxin [Proteobacteria bacterium]|nr:type II toxin-antitoxin system prevent-host-death family antitoxin [Pseudomonadota bacterium]
MQTITAKDVKFAFGRLIDLTHGEPMRNAFLGPNVVEEEGKRLRMPGRAVA